MCVYLFSVKCLFFIGRNKSMALEGNLVKLEGLGMNPSRAEHNFYFFFFF